MANTSISNLSAGAAVSATDLVPNVQTVGVGPVKTTAAQLKTFMSASPTLVTPTLGVATATSLNKITFMAPATSATLTLLDGKTITFSNTLTFTGTDSSSIAFGTGGTVAYTANNLGVFAATTSSQLAGVISDETGTGSLVFSASPTFTGIVNGADLTLSGTLTTGTWASSGFTLSSAGIITESTTSRTLSASDNGKVIYCTSSSATTITTATALGAGFSVTIMQGGTGKVTVAQGSSTTLVSYSSLFSAMGQYAVISLVCPVADTFVAAGNLGV